MLTTDRQDVYIILSMSWIHRFPIIETYLEYEESKCKRCKREYIEERAKAQYYEWKAITEVALANGYTMP